MKTRRDVAMAASALVALLLCQFGSGECIAQNEDVARVSGLDLSWSGSYLVSMMNGEMYQVESLRFSGGSQDDLNNSLGTFESVDFERLDGERYAIRWRFKPVKIRRSQSFWDKLADEAVNEALNKPANTSAVAFVSGLSGVARDGSEWSLWIDANDNPLVRVVRVE